MIVATSNFINCAAKYFVAISAGFLTLMALLGTADVLALNILGIPIPSATEIIASMMPIAIMMAMSYTQITRSHVTVDLFKKHFSVNTTRILDALALFVGFVVFLLMAYGAWQLAFNSVNVDERAVAAVRFPIWPVKILFAFGISVCALQMLLDLIVTCTSGPSDKPSPEHKQKD